MLLGPVHKFYPTETIGSYFTFYFLFHFIFHTHNSLALFLFHNLGLLTYRFPTLSLAKKQNFGQDVSIYGLKKTASRYRGMII